MIKEKAYAKLNLFLNVVGKRPDGFHNLVMIMVPIELHDVITFKQTNDDDIQITSNVEITEDVTTNIVHKVATYLKTKYSIPQGLHIDIKKRIPIAAGLAGGSADAAATLRGLNQLWNLGLSLGTLANIGLQFGSDIPFCIYNKLALARGRGEQLQFLEQQLEIPLLVVNPNIPIHTKEVFSRVDTDHIKTLNIDPIIDAIKTGNTKNIGSHLYNDLECIAFEINTEISDLKEHIKRHRPMGLLMTGSGASIFAFDDDVTRLQIIKDSLPKEYFSTLTKMR